MDMSSIDARTFRDALGHYASGITIISGMVEGEPVGFTCQSFYSVSTEPPLVSFSVMKSSTSWPKIRPVRNFAVNLLSWDQLEISNTFAKAAVDRWAKVGWTESTHGNPLIEGALFWLDCETYAEHEAGDHTIVIGRVRYLCRPADRNNLSPLIFYRGSYRQLSETRGL